MLHTSVIHYAMPCRLQAVVNASFHHKVPIELPYIREREMMRIRVPDTYQIYIF